MVLAVSDAAALASMPDNDFSWSPWSDGGEASRELEACVAGLWDDRVMPLLETLFLPTGPLQELSLSSGWGDAMVAVAERFDRERIDPDCACLSPPFAFDAFDAHPAGTDRAGGRFADVSVAACRTCRRKFLHYAWELEGISRSGRWIRAPLSLMHPHPSATEAPHVLSLAPFHYVGGSYFASTGTLQPRPLDPRTAF